MTLGHRTSDCRKQADTPDYRRPDQPEDGRQAIKIELARKLGLGLLRRQVRWITAWQMTSVTVIALLIGLPLGIALGRWVWVLFATGLGIAGGTVTPVLIVVLMVPAAVLAANAVAFWPARTAARLSPAEVLHTE